MKNFSEEFQKIELIADLRFFTVNDLQFYLPSLASTICDSPDCTPRQGDGVMLQACKYLPL